MITTSIDNKMSFKRFLQVFVQNLLLLAVICQSDQPKEKIIFIDEIIRHGARASISSMGRTTDWISQYGFQELTTTGMRMHYIAGKDLKNAYPDIFDHNFKNDELWVRSTGYNRTIQSAMAHQYGIFNEFQSIDIPFDPKDPKNLPQGGNLRSDITWESITSKTALNINYNGIPIRAPDKNFNDPFLKGDDSCLLARKNSVPITEARVRELNSSRYLQDPIERAFTKFNLSDKMIETYGHNLTNSFLVADFFISDVANNPKPLLNLLNYEDMNLYKKMEKIYTLGMTEQVRDPKFQQVIVTDYMLGIKHNLNTKADAYLTDTPEINLKKYELLSAHDSTILQTLYAAKLWDQDCQWNEFKSEKDGNCNLYPPLASSLLFELVDTDISKKKLKVRVNLNGKYLNWCKLKDDNISGKWDCDLEAFNQSVTDMIYKGDWKNACNGGDQPESDDHFMSYDAQMITCVVCVCLLVLLFVCLLCLFVKLQKGNKKMRLVQQSQSGEYSDEYVKHHG